MDSENIRKVPSSPRGSTYRMGIFERFDEELVQNFMGLHAESGAIPQIPDVHGTKESITNPPHQAVKINHDLLQDIYDDADSGILIPSNDCRGMIRDCDSGSVIQDCDSGIMVGDCEFDAVLDSSSDLVEIVNIKSEENWTSSVAHDKSDNHGNILCEKPGTNQMQKCLDQMKVEATSESSQKDSEIDQDRKLPCLSNLKAESNEHTPSSSRITPEAPEQTDLHRSESHDDHEANLVEAVSSSAHTNIGVISESYSLAKPDQTKPAPSCPECGEVFSSLRERDNHFRSVHSDCEMPLSCQVCGRGYFDNKVLLKHYRRNHATMYDILIASVNSAIAESQVQAEALVQTEAQLRVEAQENTQEQPQWKNEFDGSLGGLRSESSPLMPIADQNITEDCNSADVKPNIASLNEKICNFEIMGGMQSGVICKVENVVSSPCVASALESSSAAELLPHVGSSVCAESLPYSDLSQCVDPSKSWNVPEHELATVPRVKNVVALIKDRIVGSFTLQDHVENVNGPVSDFQPTIEHVEGGADNNHELPHTTQSANRDVLNFSLLSFLEQQRSCSSYNSNKPDQPPNCHSSQIGNSIIDKIKRRCAKMVDPVVMTGRKTIVTKSGRSAPCLGPGSSSDGANDTSDSDSIKSMPKKRSFGCIEANAMTGIHSLEKKMKGSVKAVEPKIGAWRSRKSHLPQISNSMNNKQNRSVLMMKDMPMLSILMPRNSKGALKTVRDVQPEQSGSRRDIQNAACPRQTSSDTNTSDKSSNHHQQIADSIKTKPRRKSAQKNDTVAMEGINGMAKHHEISKKAVETAEYDQLACEEGVSRSVPYCHRCPICADKSFETWLLKSEHLLRVHGLNSEFVRKQVVENSDVAVRSHTMCEEVNTDSNKPPVDMCVNCGHGVSLVFHRASKNDKFYLVDNDLPGRCPMCLQSNLYRTTFAHHFAVVHRLYMYEFKSDRLHSYDEINVSVCLNRQKHVYTGKAIRETDKCIRTIYVPKWAEINVQYAEKSPANNHWSENASSSKLTPRIHVSKILGEESTNNTCPEEDILGKRLQDWNSHMQQVKRKFCFAEDSMTIKLARKSNFTESSKRICSPPVSTDQSDEAPHSAIEVSYADNVDFAEEVDDDLPEGPELGVSLKQLQISYVDVFHDYHRLAGTSHWNKLARPINIKRSHVEENSTSSLCYQRLQDMLEENHQILAMKDAAASYVAEVDDISICDAQETVISNVEVSTSVERVAVLVDHSCPDVSKEKSCSPVVSSGQSDEASHSAIEVSDADNVDIAEEVENDLPEGPELGVSLKQLQISYVDVFHDYHSLAGTSHWKKLARPINIKHSDVEENSTSSLCCQRLQDMLEENHQILAMEDEAASYVAAVDGISICDAVSRDTQETVNLNHGNMKETNNMQETDHMILKSGSSGVAEVSFSPGGSGLDTGISNVKVSTSFGKVSLMVDQRCPDVSHQRSGIRKLAKGSNVKTLADISNSTEFSERICSPVVSTEQCDGASHSAIEASDADNVDIAEEVEDGLHEEPELGAPLNHLRMSYATLLNDFRKLEGTSRRKKITRPININHSDVEENSRSSQCYQRLLDMLEKNHQILVMEDAAAPDVAEADQISICDAVSSDAQETVNRSHGTDKMQDTDNAIVNPGSYGVGVVSFSCPDGSYQDLTDLTAEDSVSRDTPNNACLTELGSISTGEQGDSQDVLLVDAIGSTNQEHACSISDIHHAVKSAPYPREVSVGMRQKIHQMSCSHKITAISRFNKTTEQVSDTEEDQVLLLDIDSEPDSEEKV